MATSATLEGHPPPDIIKCYCCQRTLSYLSEFLRIASKLCQYCDRQVCTCCMRQGNGICRKCDIRRKSNLNPTQLGQLSNNAINKLVYSLDIDIQVSHATNKEMCIHMIQVFLSTLKQSSLALSKSKPVKEVIISSAANKTQEYQQSKQSMTSQQVDVNVKTTVVPETQHKSDLQEDFDSLIKVTDLKKIFETESTNKSGVIRIPLKITTTKTPSPENISKETIIIERNSNVIQNQSTTRITKTEITKETTTSSTSNKSDYFSVWNKISKEGVINQRDTKTDNVPRKTDIKPEEQIQIVESNNENEFSKEPVQLRHHPENRERRAEEMLRWSLTQSAETDWSKLLQMSKTQTLTTGNVSAKLTTTRNESAKEENDRDAEEAAFSNAIMKWSTSMIESETASTNQTDLNNPVVDNDSQPTPYEDGTEIQKGSLQELLNVSEEESLRSHPEELLQNIDTEAVTISADQNSTVNEETVTYVLTTKATETTSIISKEDDTSIEESFQATESTLSANKDAALELLPEQPPDDEYRPFVNLSGESEIVREETLNYEILEIEIRDRESVTSTEQNLIDTEENKNHDTFSDDEEKENVQSSHASNAESSADMQTAYSKGLTDISDEEQLQSSPINSTDVMKNAPQDTLMESFNLETVSQSDVNEDKWNTGDTIKESQDNGPMLETRNDQENEELSGSDTKEIVTSEQNSDLFKITPEIELMVEEQVELQANIIINVIDSNGQITEDILAAKKPSNDVDIRPTDNSDDRQEAIENTELFNSTNNVTTQLDLHSQMKEENSQSSNDDLMTEVKVEELNTEPLLVISANPTENVTVSNEINVHMDLEGQTVQNDDENVFQTELSTELSSSSGEKDIESETTDIPPKEISEDEVSSIVESKDNGPKANIPEDILTDTNLRDPSPDPLIETSKEVNSSTISESQNYVDIFTQAPLSNQENECQIQSSKILSDDNEIMKNSNEATTLIDLIQVTEIENQTAFSGKVEMNENINENILIDFTEDGAAVPAANTAEPVISAAENNYLLDRSNTDLLLETGNFQNLQTLEFNTAIQTVAQPESQKTMINETNEEQRIRNSEGLNGFEHNNASSESIDLLKTISTDVVLDNLETKVTTSQLPTDEDSVLEITQLTTEMKTFSSTELFKENITEIQEYLASNNLREHQTSILQSNNLLEGNKERLEEENADNSTFSEILTATVGNVDFNKVIQSATSSESHTKISFQENVITQSVLSSDQTFKSLQDDFSILQSFQEKTNPDDAIKRRISHITGNSSSSENSSSEDEDGDDRSHEEILRDLAVKTRSEPVTESSSTSILDAVFTKTKLAAFTQEVHNTTALSGGLNVAQFTIDTQPKKVIDEEDPSYPQEAKDQSASNKTARPQRDIDLYSSSSDDEFQSASEGEDNDNEVDDKTQVEIQKGNLDLPHLLPTLKDFSILTDLKQTHSIKTIGHINKEVLALSTNGSHKVFRIQEENEKDEMQHRGSTSILVSKRVSSSMSSSQLTTTSKMQSTMFQSSKNTIERPTSEEIADVWEDIQVTGASGSQICQICRTACVDCTLMDCGHQATCIDCGSDISKCPICGKRISNVCT